MPAPSGCETRCPACDHRELSREQSELAKLRWLERALAPWRAALEPVRGARDERRWGYREKSCLRAEWRDGAWRFGVRVRVRASSDFPGARPRFEVVPIPRCPVQSENLNLALGVLSESLPREIPLAFVAVSGSLLTLVLKTDTLPGTLLSETSLDRLRSLGVAGVFVNLNASAGNRVFSSRGWRLVWGVNRARASSGLVHGPESFQQLLPELHEQALREAAGFLAAGPGDSVIDLCSGLGGSLALWSRAGARAIGVELSGEAVECAAENALGVPCLRGKASERIPQLEEWRGSSASVLAYVNPPRTGLEAETSRWLAERCRPRRLAYLSCSAGTLARDLSIFERADYLVKRIIPYDFFPQTRHIETLACLELGSG